MACMTDRAIVRLLLGSILAVGAAAAYGIQGARLSDVLINHHPVAAVESYLPERPNAPDRHVISGRVIDSRGLAPHGVVIRVTAPKADGSGTLSSTSIGADGSFETQRFPPGEYVLTVMEQTPGYDFVVPSEGAFALVTIGTSNVRDVTLRTIRNVTVDGKFRMESDNPSAAWPPEITVGAYLALDGMNLVPSAHPEGGPGGTFVLRGVRGPHVLRCGYSLAPGNWWWPSKVLLDGVDITNVPTDFGDAENSRLEVVFTQHPAGFTGTVSDPKGQPVPSALVVLFSADRALWQPWSTTSHVLVADAKGAFSVPVLPGRYLARALPPGAFPSRRARPDYERFSREAVAVELGERERKILTLTIGSF
jgi:hypothetical protein